MHVLLSLHAVEMNDSMFELAPNLISEQDYCNFLQ